MKYLGIVVLATFLSACAIWAPGKDPRGEKVVSNANEVLSALNKYAIEHSVYPSLLNDLVPNYIKAIPKEPSMLYKPDEGSIFFTYSPSWPQQGNVSCGAKIGDKTVGCNGYI